jgi:pantetheine-phosphate adenylyltransferase
MFTLDDRIGFIQESLGGTPNVTVEGFATLVVEFARERGAQAIVKGLRAVSDFEWEFQMNNLNRGMAPEIETMYLMASPEYSFLSSRGVREIAAFGGSVAQYVPEPVARRLAELHAAGEL